MKVTRDSEKHHDNALEHWPIEQKGVAHPHWDCCYHLQDSRSSGTRPGLMIQQVHMGHVIFFLSGSNEGQPQCQVSMALSKGVLESVLHDRCWSAE